MSTTTKAVCSGGTSSCTFQRPCRSITRLRIWSGMTTLWATTASFSGEAGRAARPIHLLAQPVEHIRHGLGAVVVHQVDTATFVFRPDTQMLRLREVVVGLMRRFDRHQSVVLAVRDHHGTLRIFQNSLEREGLQFLARLALTIRAYHPFDLRPHRRPEIVDVVSQIVARAPHDRSPQARLPRGAAAAVVAAHRLTNQRDLGWIDVRPADEIIHGRLDRDLVIWTRVDVADAQRLAHPGPVEAEDAEPALQHLLGGEEIQFFRDDIDATEIGYSGVSLPRRAERPVIIAGEKTVFEREADQLRRVVEERESLMETGDTLQI